MASEFDEMELQAFVEALRREFTGAWVRKAGEFRDLGELVLATVGRADAGSAVEVDDNGTDVWVHFVGMLDGRAGIGKLFSPGNCLWRLPPKGAVVLVGKPSSPTQIGGIDGPGVPLVFYGEGEDGAIPDALNDLNMVLSPPTGALVLESRDDNVDLVSDTGHSKAVRANGSDFDALKTQDFLSELSGLLGDLVTELAKGTSGSPVAQTLVGMATITTKIAAFQAKLASATTFRSTKFQHG